MKKRERIIKVWHFLGMFSGYHHSPSPDIRIFLAMPDVAISLVWDTLADLLKNFSCLIFFKLHPLKIS